MPWTNQSGGGGGPWGQRGSGGGKSPWGSGPQGGPPSDFEDMLRRSQDRLKGFFPGGSFGGRGLAAIVVGVLVVWLLTGIYTVRPNEVGINLIFGKYYSSVTSGLRYNLPYPIGEVEKPDVRAQQRVEVGYRSSPGQGRAQDLPQESLMLTGDENIIDIDFDVVWQINPEKAQDFVFNLSNPQGTIKAVAESAMREVVGRRNIQPILTTDQTSVAQEVRQIMQATLDNYQSGILINVVQLQAAQPPAEVRQAFIDVNAAQQDAVRLQNEAETYASRTVPVARGDAAKTIQQAEGYREQARADAMGQASRFNQVYDQYQKAPGIIRERIFIETMERVMSGMDKIIIDQSGQNGVVPYLPLNEMQRRAAPSQSGQNVPQGATR